MSGDKFIHLRGDTRNQTPISKARLYGVLVLLSCWSSTSPASVDSRSIQQATYTSRHGECRLMNNSCNCKSRLAKPFPGALGTTSSLASSNITMLNFRCSRLLYNRSIESLLDTSTAMAAPPGSPIHPSMPIRPSHLLKVAHRQASLLVSASGAAESLVIRCLLQQRERTLWSLQRRP